MLRTAPRNFAPTGRSKFPIVLHQEQHEQALPALAVRRHFQPSIQIFAFKTHNTDRINVTQLPFAHDESRARYFDGIRRGALASTERFEQPARLSATATAQLRYRNRPGKPFHDLIRIAPQQTFVGPRVAVLGQSTGSSSSLAFTNTPERRAQRQV